MSHWPDLERCERLKEKGFPQDTEFVWATDNVDAFWVVHTLSRNYWCEDTVCAAPIVTELEAEIKKLNPPKREDEAWIDIDIMADGTVYAGIPELLEECEYHQADTIPNVLTDLWLWLRGRK